MVGKENNSGQKDTNAPFQRGIIELLKKLSPPRGGEVGTFELGAGEYVITEADKIQGLGFYLNSGGAGTYQGSAVVQAFGGASIPLDMVPELPTIFTAPGYIKYFKIVVTTGPLEVVINKG